MSAPAIRGPRTRVLRRTRGVTVAAASTLVTAVGHVVGGGAAPDLGLLIVLFPLFAALVISFAEACRSVVGMLAVLAGGQLALHEIMVVVAEHHAGPDSGSGLLMVAMHAVATLLMGLLIRAADVGLVALVVALARVLPRKLALPSADRPLHTFVVPAPAAVRVSGQVLLGPAPRRGPPVWV